MTSPGHVTTASLKQANNKNDNRGVFLSACISKSSAHPSLKIHTVNLGTLNITCTSNNVNCPDVVSKRNHDYKIMIQAA